MYCYFLIALLKPEHELKFLICRDAGNALVPPLQHKAAPNRKHDDLNIERIHPSDTNGLFEQSNFVCKQLYIRYIYNILHRHLPPKGAQ